MKMLMAVAFAKMIFANFIEVSRFSRSWRQEAMIGLGSCKERKPGHSFVMLEFTNRNRLSIVLLVYAWNGFWSLRSRSEVLFQLLCERRADSGMTRATPSPAGSHGRVRTAAGRSRSAPRIR